jgi:interferon, gamma-inducible protein 30
MMKNVLVGSVAATTIDTDQAFCGCNDCTIDWVDSELQAMIGGVSCE